MDKNEIEELIELKGWSQAALAAELDVSQDSVRRWLREGPPTHGPARKMMLGWLKEARKNGRKAKVSS